MENKYCKCGCGKEVSKGRTWISGHNTNKAKDRFDWSNLEKDYKRMGSIIKVAEKYGCSHEAVHYQMRKRNIGANESKFEIENVKELYEQHKSIVKVAELVGCSLATVRERLYEMKYEFNHDNKDLNVEVGLGRYGERLALELLEGSKDMAKKGIDYPYDIEWIGKRIDVKVSRLRKRKGRKDYYSYSLGNPSCDYFLFIKLNEEEYPIEFLLIDSKLIKTKGFTLQKETPSKWQEYKLEVNEDELRKIVQNAKEIR